MVFLYITCKNEEEAKKISHELIMQKAAACVNAHPIRSVYPEGGAVKDVSEIALIAKTSESKIQHVEDIVRALHSYKTPCVATFSLSRLNREYKDWLISCVA